MKGKKIKSCKDHGKIRLIFLVVFNVTCQVQEKTCLRTVIFSENLILYKRSTTCDVELEERALLKDTTQEERSGARFIRSTFKLNIIPIYRQAKTNDVCCCLSIIIPIYKPILRKISLEFILKKQHRGQLLILVESLLNL